LSRYIAEEFVQPQMDDSSFAKFLDGKELLFASLFMEMCTGFITNGPGIKNLPPTTNRGLIFS
jgi:hypothetical protein